MTKTEIAKAFSNGEFDKTNKFISENAVWTVVEEDNFIGKQSLIIVNKLEIIFNQ
ncbi:hypothetical protein [Flavobacterium xinjiangense]|uniref:SnoaL-like domain-containing protein n=1 Tax=Flavobacterium xinjiangense TaxID=178356 RepID=A0A1M7IEJ1_9FLAO|nr:hypothetical protein [Flavobacterium xinjiangense]SHM39099.1 hypothetical protein SAMN05216269_10492 [Flavobacterium xinjiangense]